MFKGNRRAPHGGGHSCSLNIDAKPPKINDSYRSAALYETQSNPIPSKTFAHETRGDLSGSTVSTEMNHNAGRCFVTSLEKLKSTCIR